jgi:hypothetical protein
MMKKTTVIIATLAAIALLWAVPVFPGTIPSSIVPETASWVVHLDMEKFVATGLYGYLEKDGKFEIKSRDLDRWFKMDIPKDVKSVTVFGLGPGDEQIVFAVAGKFDKAGIIAMVEADKDHQKTAYGAYTLYSSGSDEYGAFINDNLLVFSEGRAVIEKVLDTAAGKAKNFAATPLSASLKAVPGTAFLSGTGPAPGDGGYPGKRQEHGRRRQRPHRHGPARRERREHGQAGHPARRAHGQAGRQGRDAGFRTAVEGDRGPHFPGQGVRLRLSRGRGSG